MCDGVDAESVVVVFGEVRTGRTKVKQEHVSR